METGRVRWAINDDVDGEFRYWMRGLFGALKLGGVCALAAAFLIVSLPSGEADRGAAFARNFWPYLVECAFWFGMFVSMLWHTGKRLGSALAGTLPWQHLGEGRKATARFFGQWSAFAALAGVFLWFTPRLALATQMDGVAAFAEHLTPLTAACWLAAGLFAAVAIISRRERRRRGEERAGSGRL